MPEMFAAVKNQRIKRFTDLAAMTRHARGQDETCKNRMVRTGPRAVAWSSLTGKTVLTDVGEESPETDLVASFRHHKEAQQAQERPGCAFALHLLAVVSPEWLDEIPEEKSARQAMFVKAAIDWANASLGDGSVFAARLDLNEKGDSVVDLFAAPVREQTFSNGKASRTKRMTAPSQALDELAKQWGRKKSYSALQDSWSAYARKHLDMRLQRGKPKSTRGADQLSPEQYGAKKDGERRIAECERDTALAEREADLSAAKKREADKEARAATERRDRLLREADQAEARKRGEDKAARAARDAREKAEAALPVPTAQVEAGLRKRDKLTRENAELDKAKGKKAHEKKELEADVGDLLAKRKRMNDAMASMQSGTEAWRALWDIVHEEGAAISRRLIRPAWELVRKTLLPAIRRAALMHDIDLEPHTPTTLAQRLERERDRFS